MTTTFPGADADLMQGFITDPIQKAVATADGIDYLTSKSYAGTSVVTVNVRLNEDPDAAMTAVTAKVNQTRSLLPRGINDPVIVKSTGDQFATMYLAFSSSTMNPGQITDYVTRVIQPKLSTVPGVADPELLGGQKFAMRIWLDPMRMAQYNISADRGAGRDRSQQLSGSRGQRQGLFRRHRHHRAHRSSQRAGIPRPGRAQQRRAAGAPLRYLHRRAGAGKHRLSVYVNGDKAVFIGIKTTPDANL